MPVGIDKVIKDYFCFKFNDHAAGRLCTDVTYIHRKIWTFLSHILTAYLKMTQMYQSLSSATRPFHTRDYTVRTYAVAEIDPCTPHSSGVSNVQKANTCCGFLSLWQEAVFWILNPRSATDIANSKRTSLVIIRKPMRSGKSFANNHKPLRHQV